MIKKVKEFRRTAPTLTLFSMAKELNKMDGESLSDEDQDNFNPALKFMYWQKFCWDTVDLPIGLMCSSSMENRPQLMIAGHYLFIGLA